MNRQRQAPERPKARTPTHQALLEASARVCRTDGSPTIAAVAREVGVSAALVHNRYPDVAATIRTLAGKVKRDEATALRTALEAEKVKCRELRGENAELTKTLRAVASINEALRRQLAIEQARAAGKLVSLPARREIRD
jgi:AcrR family transcriptional regulator